MTSRRMASMARRLANLEYEKPPEREETPPDLFSYGTQAELLCILTICDLMGISDDGMYANFPGLSCSPELEQIGHDTKERIKARFEASEHLTEQELAELGEDHDASMAALDVQLGQTPSADETWIIEAMATLHAYPDHEKLKGLIEEGWIVEN